MDDDLSRWAGQPASNGNKSTWCIVGIANQNIATIDSLCSLILIGQGLV